ncbi:glycosyltransferase [Thermus phage phiYS40]|uniref:glycosyltransferase n=1 Tax=Thermus phage phiYS40 TaxID=407392 RepID=UPI0000E689E7|nr:glycosyltransferase [Thermus phage phiYS40]ABJ91507.1 hypothetical protein YS40_113 [Thermus phage phiYS40]BAK53631.1 hypothetical protein YSP_113 [Thermus phage phiYS40]
MNKIWKWEMITKLSSYYVGSSHYVVDEFDEENTKKVYAEFSIKIFSNPKFEDLYKNLKHAESLYAYFQTFLPKEEDILYIDIETEPYSRSTKPYTSYVSPRRWKSYSDFMMNRINHVFKKNLPKLLKDNIKNVKIYASIYRRSKVQLEDDDIEDYEDSLFYEYVLFEVSLNLEMLREVI